MESYKHTTSIKDFYINISIYNYSRQTFLVLFFEWTYLVLLFGVNFPILLFGGNFPIQLFMQTFLDYCSRKTFMSYCLRQTCHSIIQGRLICVIMLEFCEQLVGTLHLRIDGDIPLTWPAKINKFILESKTNSEWAYKTWPLGLWWKCNAEFLMECCDHVIPDIRFFRLLEELWINWQYLVAQFVIVRQYFGLPRCLNFFLASLYTLSKKVS